ncbi:unnamed protein product [Adineta steineri]|uniref:RRM domain-containing protein n=2 Tax=Adineta steineri TaxID=433720 RepID=A0A814K6C4_9BILA|nr:unnamed protein product [Adineta steineri]CAF3571022.1 unnamed protein product [Adineta steineri]
MSESHRDHDKSSNTNSCQDSRNSKDETNRYNRKRSHLESENIDAKVYISNVPSKKATDAELLDFFKPFGKISDIQVFKDHIFVQYNRIDDAKKLIKEAQIPLIFKGNQLDVFPARDVRSTSAKSSSTDRSSKRSHERTSHHQSLNYEPSRKMLSTHDQSNFIPQIDRIDDRMHISLSRSNSRRSSNESISLNHHMPYSVLAGPKDSNDCVDCHIILVNFRQREYAEKIESRLASHGIVSSIILLREDLSLTKAIDNAARLQCLYGIIAMPMHEERRTASFHILYGQTEEHRNLTLDDGIHIIITNFAAYKERIRNEEIDSYRSNNNSVVYSNSNSSYEYIRPSNNLSQEEITSSALNPSGKLPLSMLLCLLADGRQLTLEEIDRVLVYLLEKKAKMLTLPSGTLPPLPAQYAINTTLNHQTGALIFLFALFKYFFQSSGIVSDTRLGLTSNPSPGKTSSSSTETSASIAEQIRQILSTNIIKSNSSMGDKNSQSTVTKSSSNNLSDTIKTEKQIPSQTNNDTKEVGQQQQQQQQQTQSSFVYRPAETVSTVPATFNYTSPPIRIANSVSPFVTATYPSYNSVTPSLGVNSAVKSATVQNFVSQPSQYFYQVPSQTLYQSPLNSTAANTAAAAALFQAYSQFNVQPSATSSIVNQQLNTQQQQQQQQQISRK